MSEQITVVEVGLQEGVRDDGSTWSRWKIKDGNGRTFSTFDAGFAEKLKQGSQATIDFEEKDLGGGRKVKNITAVQPVANGAVPEQYTHQKPDGEADWDKVAIGKTRCALWMHYLGGQLASSIYVKASNTEGVDAREAVIRAGIMYVVAAEKDTFERPPGDDGVPF